MIRELTIKNYKSILDHTIELGRINVFIGENGCGKTNILEAVAMAGAALTDKLSVEELWNRGMRVAKPSLTFSSFVGAKSRTVVLRCGFEAPSQEGRRSVALHLTAAENSSVDVRWIEQWLHLEAPLAVAKMYDESGVPKPVGRDLMPFVHKGLDRRELISLIGDFAVYSVNALALRGLQTISHRAPLGIYGETLDLAISMLKPELWTDVLGRAKCVSWLDDIVIDPSDALRYEGHKLGKSRSTLYFFDKHMRRRNNVFSAENVNEGILHILFHLTLFSSEGTPKVLGIDNIDTALNPQLCRDLMKQLAELAAKHGKQALITTHNPAILDGLNLHDDEQRLFVVARNDEGHTVTKRIKVKPQPEGQKLKLSELWMRGHLGGIPRSF